MWVLSDFDKSLHSIVSFVTWNTWISYNMLFLSFYKQSLIICYT